MVKVLLEFGADTNAPNPHGLTPLQQAEKLGRDEIRAYLEKAESVRNPAEWRKDNHNELPSPFPDAMRTLALLAKIRSDA